jgi:tripartite-type tricarboxylate transporter receptor subunit TctC
MQFKEMSMNACAKRFAKWLLVMVALWASCAWSQTYPSKPIKIIVSFTPGGGNDLFARIIAQKLWERLGQPVVVENKPGAGGIVGTQAAVRSSPDGYTLLAANNGLILAQWMTASLPFDVIKDLAPVGVGATQPMVVAVTNKIPVNSLNDLIAYAKANPDKLSYATVGIGTTHHLATEWFMNMTGTKMVQVPYKGAAGTLNALISGEVQVAFGALSAAVPYMESGKIRAIALAERQRLSQFKDLPTLNERLPGLEVTFWYGLMAPAGTPDAILNRLSEEQRTIVNMPDVRERLARVGMDSNPSSVAEMRQTMATEHAKWSKVRKDSGLQP